MSICTRNNPNKQQMMQEVNVLRDKAIAAGDKQLASLKQETSEGLFWTRNISQVAKVALGTMIVIGALYECCSHANSTNNLYAINVKYGEQEWQQNATLIMKKVASENPSLVCYINDHVVDLLTCHVRGLTDYFVNGQKN